jgi:hypothetical protein
MSLGETAKLTGVSVDYIRYLENSLGIHRSRPKGHPARKPGSRSDRVLKILQEHEGEPVTLKYLSRRLGITGDQVEAALGRTDPRYLIWEDEGLVCLIGQVAEKPRNTEWQITHGRDK